MKKTISVLLALVLALSLLPTVAAAATGNKPWEREPAKWTALTASYLETVDYKISGGCYYLNADVTLDKTLVVTDASAADKNITLDLNGHVLQYTGSAKGSVIEVQSVKVPKTDGSGHDDHSTHFVLQDSDPNTPHYFTVGDNGLWSLCTTTGCSHNNCKTVNGGVITGGTGHADGGADHGGGIYILGVGGSATAQVTAEMTGGSIVGCTANRGGGAYVRQDASFTMSGSAQIRGCTATARTDISFCPGQGGGIDNRGTLTLQDSAYIADCTAAEATSCAIHSANDGGINSGTICADGGEVHGTVFLGGNSSSNRSKITGSGTSLAVTKFYDDVTNENGTIGSGVFYGTVTNEAYQFTDPTISEEPQTDYGKITGGTFYGNVVTTNNETAVEGANNITGGTFYGSVPAGNRDVYTITWNGLPEGKNAANFTLPVAYTASSVISISELRYDGLSFTGWSGTNLTGNPTTFTIANSTGNLEFTANWTTGTNQTNHYHRLNPSAEVAQSPKTFDAGIGLYAVTALLACTGSAVVIGKKKEF